MIGFTHRRTINKGAKKFICSSVLKRKKKGGGRKLLNANNYRTVEIGNKLKKISPSFNIVETKVNNEITSLFLR